MHYKTKFSYLVLVLYLILSSCGTTQNKNKVTDSISDIPGWINNYKNEYPDMLYLSNMGVSEYKSMAEKQAYQGIASAFEIQIKSTQNSKEVTFESADEFSQTYNEVFNINTSTNQNLINIQTSESYFDAKSDKYYVLATLNKSQTSAIYQEKRIKLLDDAQSIYSQSIYENDLLTKIALISNSIVKLKEVDKIDAKLRILDNASMATKMFKEVHELVIEREKILDKVPVFIQNNDNKIYNDLKEEFTDLGFKISSDKDKAIIVVNFDLEMNNSEVINQDAKFVMWHLNVNLSYQIKNHTFGTYLAKGRSSQLSSGAARERAYFDIAKKMDKEFKIFLMSEILRIKK